MGQLCGCHRRRIESGCISCGRLCRKCRLAAGTIAGSARIRTCIDRVGTAIEPSARNFHDAFGYFGRAYGLEVVGVQGLSTESEAGLQRINELVDLLKAQKISAVFVESSVPRKNILALIDGAKSRGHEVKVGGELYSDAMGVEGTYEGTYVGMLDHNITLVTGALGGVDPDGGLNGKLKVTTDQP